MFLQHVPIMYLRSTIKVKKDFFSLYCPHLIVSLSSALRYSRSEKLKYICFFSHLIVPLTTPKVLTFDNKSEKRLFPFVLSSLNRTFAHDIQIQTEKIWIN